MQVQAPCPHHLTTHIHKLFCVMQSIGLNASVHDNLDMETARMEQLVSQVVQRWSREHTHTHTRTHTHTTMPTPVESARRTSSKDSSHCVSHTRRTLNRVVQPPFNDAALNLLRRGLGELGVNHERPHALLAFVGNAGGR